MKIFGWISCAGFCLATSTLSPALAADYDEVRRSQEATSIDSVAYLRANAQVLAGQVVELQGEVSGVMTRDKSRIVLLKVGNDMSVLSAPPEFSNMEYLRAGVLVRLLARVDEANPSGVLTILAAREGVVPEPPATAQSSVEPDSVDFLTPMVTTVEMLPQAPATPSSAPAPSTVARATQSSTPARTVSAKPLASELDDLIESQIPAYAAIVRRHNKKLSPELVNQIAEALLRAGYRHNMDPRFLAAIVAVESNFDPRSVSRSGAMGLGQIMPFNLKTAGIQNPWDPGQNVMGAAKLLRGLLDSYQGRPNATLLAVAGYNAGAGAVRRAGYKVPPGAQVQRYVWKVYYRYKAFAPELF